MKQARWILSAVVFCSAAATAAAQNGEKFVVPPPPRLSTGPNQPVHQPRMQEPGNAYDWMTKRSYFWSCDKKTWVDNKTGQEIGYDGFAAKNGDIIPPPERDALTGVRAVQSAANPDHATDPKTGADLAWDYKDLEWKDTKSTRRIPGQGWVLNYCPENMKTLDKLARGSALQSHGVDEESGVPPIELHFDIDYRKYINWSDVIGKVPGTASSDGTDTGIGFGAGAGVKLGGLPIYGITGGYCAFGLNADIMLDNGRRSTSDVTDCGGQFEFRYYPVNKRFQPYLDIGGMFQANSSKYKEFKSDGTVVFSERRKLSSWTATYGGGMVVWPWETLGIDFGFAYNGRFRSENADENYRLSSGLVLRLGKQ